MRRNSFIEMSKLHDLSGRIAEKIIGNGISTTKETSKETDSRIHVGDNPAFQTERKKIPFPINPHWEFDMKKNAKHPRTDSTEKESIIKQIKAEQKPVSIETGQTAEKLPYPEPSILASKYPHLREIEGRLKEQNKAIFGRERQRDGLKKELSECTGIFKGGRRKELQREIDSLDIQISNMKRRLSSIVKEYDFDSVRAFYKELNAAKQEKQEYEVACVEYEKICGEKAKNFKSLKIKLKQAKKISEEQEKCREDRTHNRSKGAR